MRLLPKKQLFRINNPINDKKVDDSSINKEMLENELATYYRFKNNAIDTKDPTDDDLVDDGIAYNKFRLENSAVPIEDSPFSADYRAGDLYRLQNPNFMTEPSGTVYSPLLVQKIRQYYLMNPQYHLAYYDVSAEAPSGEPTPSAVFSEIVRQVYTPEPTQNIVDESTTNTTPESTVNVIPVQATKTVQQSTIQLVQQPITVSSNDMILAEFEAEYEAFIAMLREQRNINSSISSDNI